MYARCSRIDSVTRHDDIVIVSERNTLLVERTRIFKFRQRTRKKCLEDMTDRFTLSIRYFGFFGELFGCAFGQSTFADTKKSNARTRVRLFLYKYRNELTQTILERKISQHQSCTLTYCRYT